MKARDTFGTIFLVVGIVLFYFIGSTSIASELDDILHGPPPHRTGSIKAFTRDQSDDR